MMNVALQMIIYCVILVVLAIPLGSYMGKVMNGERVFLSRLLLPVENLIYRGLRIDKEEEMDWKKYSVCTAVFSVMSLAVLWAILCFQNLLPLNPQGMGKMSWHLGFNTAASFTTNTNWQAYSGESSLSYFSQMIGLNFQNFVSDAVGIDPRIRPREGEGTGKLLHRHDKDSPLHTDSAVSGGISCHCLPGCSADL